MRKHFYYKNNTLISIELYRAKDEFSIGLELNTDFENTIVFNLCLPFLFKFYIALNAPLCKTSWWQKILLLDEEHKYNGRVFEISFRPDEVAWGKNYWLSIQFGTYPWESGGGWSFFKSLTDVIYGRFTYNKTVKEEWNKTVFIPGLGDYSDGTYDLIIKREVANWKWERFNKTYSFTYFDVICEKGVPNRFKYGSQDSIFSACLEASHVDEAIQKFIDNVQKERLKL